MMGDMSYLLARFLDLLENGVVGSSALNDNLLVLERNIKGGNTCIPGV